MSKINWKFKKFNLSRKTKGEDNSTLFFYQALLLVTIAIGIYVRFKGLGKWPFAGDEYYIAKSVRNILEYGVPQFSCGGYYVRGILYQYIATPLFYFFSNDEFWLRFIPVVSNILAIPPLYLIGKRLFGKPGACLSVVFFVFSIWEIEFARFARMYVPFQAIFLWYLLFFFRVFVDKDHNSWKWLYILSFVSIFVYEGSIFLLLFNFIPIILNYRQKYNVNLICSAVLFIFGYIFLSIDFRHLGAVPYLPADFSIPVNSGGGSILLPNLLVTFTFHNAVWIFFVLVPAFLSIVCLFKLIKHNNLNNLAKLCLCAITGMSFFNLFGLLIIFSAVCYLLGIIQWSSLNKKVLKLCCFVILFNFIFWIIFCCTTHDWFHLLEGMENFSVRKLFVVLFKYPDIFKQIIFRWLIETPRLAIISAIIIFLGVFGVIKKRSVQKEYLILSAILLICFLLVGVVKTPYNSTRYSFFFYPLILLLVAGSISFWATTISQKNKLVQVLIFSFGLIYMLGVEDFGVHHLAAIDSKEVNFRLCYNYYKKMHYCFRLDYASPAQIINKKMQKKDIIISTIAQVDYYLKRLDYIYNDNSFNEFMIITACAGKNHIWTNAKLIYKEEALWKLLDNNPATVWLITSSENTKFLRSNTTRKINKIYKKYFVGESLDGSINVYQIKSR